VALIGVIQIEIGVKIVKISVKLIKNGGIMIKIGVEIIKNGGKIKKKLREKFLASNCAFISSLPWLIHPSS
jgi:hypothetical protein